MTDGGFPYPAIGLVHIANRIVQHQRLDAREPLSLRVWATQPEPHPRGTQFSIRSQARSGDELVWEEVSTNLHRGRENPDVVVPSTPPSTESQHASATWRCPGDLGRRYGAVSGDLNPIHVHAPSARLFGFRSAIAHGMWTKARCLAALDRELPGAFTVEVAFKRPILLPSTVEYVEARDGEMIRFGVRDAKRPTPHLDGLVSF
jgi:acyl dehydratase